ncbi:MAG: SDR family oxidoreductase [Bacteroidales bacterium]|nr:SDR family oxidoreductase [Bacteroidales bacterium]
MVFFQGKVVWLTGASSGIGLAILELLSRQGARLIITSSDVSRLNLAAEKCILSGAECKILPCDLTDSRQVSGLAAKALAFFGKIDVLILNAGKSQRALTIDTSIEVDRLLMELNYFSNVIITKEILNSMKANGGGHIAVTSSITGKFGFPLRSAYAAAKHALHGFFETLGIEERKNGIFVTIICPGRVNTPISYNALLANGESYNRLDKGQENGMPAELCARKYLRAVQKKKREVLIGNKEILMVYIKRYFPSIFYKIADSIKST